jgi:hypothetical protein
MLHNYRPSGVPAPQATCDELNRNAAYTIALRNAEAFVRTLAEIRALPEKEDA